MRRDTFLRSLAVLTAAGLLPPMARAQATSMKLMIPANPGGGWDTTGRALGKALQEARAAGAVTYENKGVRQVRSALRSSSMRVRATPTPCW